MVQKLLGVVGLLVVLVLGAAAMGPDKMHVERSIVIEAPTELVFGIVNDMKNFKDWSPWQELDPNMQSEFGGAEAGVGQTYHWVGNDQVGEGKMAITESVPNERITQDLEFIKPFESKAVTTLALSPEGSGVKLTWIMDSPNNFMSKLFGLFMDFDKSVGADFEKGLTKLKGLSETRAAEQRAAEEAAAADAARLAAGATALDPNSIPAGGEVAPPAAQ